MNSIGWIFIKSTPEHNEETMSKRLKFLQTNLKDEKQADPTQIDNIIDTVINNKHFYISRKSTGKEETEE